MYCRIGGKSSFKYFVPADYLTSFAVQEQRLRGRGTEPEDKILARLARTREELTFADRYDYVVYNHDGRVDEAAEEILSIIRAECASLRRNPTVEKDYFAD